MTVVEHPAENAHAEPAKVLIEEAKHHQRKRRAAMGICLFMVLVGGGIAWWSISGGGGGAVTKGHSSSHSVGATPTGTRLLSTETICDGQVILRPPAPSERPLVSPRFSASELPVLQIVGTLPTPEVVYARVTTLGFGPIIGGVVRPSFDNVPEWVVIYRDFDFRPLGGQAPDHRGVDASQDRGRQTIARGETALLLLSPTTSALLDARRC